MIQVFTVAIFLYTSNLKLERNSYLDSTSSVKPHEGFVIQVGRKLLQAKITNLVLVITFITAF